MSLWLAAMLIAAARPPAATRPAWRSCSSATSQPRRPRASPTASAAGASCCKGTPAVCADGPGGRPDRQRVLFVGTSNGLVYRTVDGGETWWEARLWPDERWPHMTTFFRDYNYMLLPVWLG